MDMNASGVMRLRGRVLPNGPAIPDGDGILLPLLPFTDWTVSKLPSRCPVIKDSDLQKDTAIIHYTPHGNCTKPKKASRRFKAFAEFDDDDC